MKKVIIIVVALLVPFAAFAQQASDPLAVEFYETQILQLTRVGSALQAKAAALEAKIKELTAQKADADKKVKELTDENTKLGDKVKALEAEKAKAAEPPAADKKP